MWLFPPSLNLAAQGAGLSASSQNQYFPVSQILSTALACATWRSSTENNATETLTIALPADVTATAYPNGLWLLLDYWNAPSTCSLVTAAFNGALSSATLYPLTGTQGVNYGGVAAGPVWFNLQVPAGGPFTSLTFTFVRNASATNYIEVGKLFLGIYFDTTAAGTPGYGDYTRTFDELVNKDVSQLGQSFSEKRASFWAAKVTVPVVVESIQAQLRTLIFEALGTYTPFWIVIYPQDASTSELGYPRYVKQTTKPDETVVNFGNGYIWKTQLSLSKQL